MSPNCESGSFHRQDGRLAGAVFAPKDGLVNPNIVKNYYRNEARKLGVVFDDRTVFAGSWKFRRLKWTFDACASACSRTKTKSAFTRAKT